MTHKVKIMNAKGKCEREFYAVSIQQAWVIRRKFATRGLRGKIEVLS